MSKKHTLEDTLVEMRAVQEDKALRFQAENYYSVEYRCLNCGFSDVLEIRKGIQVQLCPCPNCLCTIRESEKL